MLTRILRAYAIYSPQVGYCQGINFVVGELLLANFSEEDAFWALRHLMKKHYLEGMFLPGILFLILFYFILFYFIFFFNSTKNSP